MIKRYSVSEIEKIFADSSKYQHWLDIELLVLKYLKNSSTITQKDFDVLNRELIVIPQKVREIERNTNHDVVAFINQISQSTENPSKKWIHYGLTSSDLVDTGNSIMLQKTNEILLRKAYKLLLRMKRLSFLHKDTCCLLRTSGLKVQGITSFGYQIAHQYENLREAISDLERHRKYIECASISGSMGICSHIDVGLQNFVAQELGLYSSTCSTQVLSRDRYYRYLQILSRIVQSIHNMCLVFRLQSRTEIGEVGEFFGKGQAGSSSMPHKRNPITLENICGLCRLFNSYYSVTSKNIAIWMERDISHSSVDRVVFLDGVTVAVQIIKKAYSLLNGLFVDEERMKKNIELNEYRVFKDGVCRTLIREFQNILSPSEIIQDLEEINRRALDNNINFSESFAATDFADRLGKEKVKQLFNPRNHLSFLDTFYKRIFIEEQQKQAFNTIFYEQSDIFNAIESIALKLNDKYLDAKNPVKLIAVRETSVVFLSRLLIRLNFPIELKTVSSWVAEGLLEKGKGISKDSFDISSVDVKGQDVILLDGILKTEEIMSALKKCVSHYGAKSIFSVVLFASHEKKVHKFLDLYGLLIPIMEGIAGFGIANSDGLFSNCNFLGKLKDNHLPV